MSVLTNQSEVNPNKAFWAPASGGGGGGGGNVSTISALTVSSIAAIGQTSINILDDVNVDPSKQFNGGGSNANTGVSMNGFQSIACGSLETTAINPNYSASAISVGASLALGPNGLSASTIAVSSINGAQYPPAATDAFSSITAQSGLFSSIGSYPGGPNNINATANFTVYGNITIPEDSLYTVGVNTSTLTTTFINGNNAANVAYQNGYAFFSTVGAGVINAKIQNTTYPAGVSSLVPVGMWGNAGVTPFNWIQAGYVEGLPYASTVAFSRPYPDNNSLPAVILTPTNFQVTGGANPNLSLNANYGIGGVSTVGFSVDARDAGLGYSGAFYWMAVPQTQ